MRIGPAPAAELPKAERMKLAQAELWLLLGVEADEWARCISGSPETLPFEQWPPDDPFRALAHTYGLAPTDLVRLLDRIGQACEQRALRGGYEQHWRHKFQHCFSAFMRQVVYRTCHRSQLRRHR